MATDSTPDIAVLAQRRHSGEALALSIAKRTSRMVVALTGPDSSVLTSCSRVLVESDLHLESTLKLIREIKLAHPNVVLVVLGSSESEEDIAKIADAGACGYIPANASFEEMLSLLRTVRTGEFVCPPHITHALFSYLAALARNRRIGLLQSAGLTMRERQIAELSASYLSNREIADQLCVAECTIKSHIHRLRKKLNCSGCEIADRVPRLPQPLETEL